MAEYIDKTKAVESIETLMSSIPAKDDYEKGYDTAMSSALIAVREVIEADVQPVKHGRWEYFKNNGIFDTHKCTLCGEKYEMYMDIEPTTIYKYCPNCGARMGGEQNEND